MSRKERHSESQEISPRGLLKRMESTGVYKGNLWEQPIQEFSSLKPILKGMNSTIDRINHWFRLQKESESITERFYPEDKLSDSAEYPSLEAMYIFSVYSSVQVIHESESFIHGLQKQKVPKEVKEFSVKNLSPMIPPFLSLPVLSEYAPSLAPVLHHEESSLYDVVLEIADTMQKEGRDLHIEEFILLTEIFENYIKADASSEQIMKYHINNWFQISPVLYEGLLGKLNDAASRDTQKICSVLSSYFSHVLETIAFEDDELSYYSAKFLKKHMNFSEDNLSVINGILLLEQTRQVEFTSWLSSIRERAETDDDEWFTSFYDFVLNNLHEKEHRRVYTSRELHQVLPIISYEEMKIPEDIFSFFPYIVKDRSLKLNFEEDEMIPFYTSSYEFISISLRRDNDLLVGRLSLYEKNKINRQIINGQEKLGKPALKVNFSLRNSSVPAHIRWDVLDAEDVSVQLDLALSTLIYKGMQEKISRLTEVESISFVEPEVQNTPSITESKFVSVYRSRSKGPAYTPPKATKRKGSERKEEKDVDNDGLTTFQEIVENRSLKPRLHISKDLLNNVDPGHRDLVKKKIAAFHFSSSRMKFLKNIVSPTGLPSYEFRVGKYRVLFQPSESNPEVAEVYDIIQRRELDRYE